jgi:hypothetical protein
MRRAISILPTILLLATILAESCADNEPQRYSDQRVTDSQRGSTPNSLIAPQADVQGMSPISTACALRAAAEARAITHEEPIAIGSKMSGFVAKSHSGVVWFSFMSQRQKTAADTCAGALDLVYLSLAPGWTRSDVEFPGGAIERIAMRSISSTSVILTVTDSRRRSRMIQLNDSPKVLMASAGSAVLRYRRTWCDPTHVAIHDIQKVEVATLIETSASGPLLTRTEIPDPSECDRPPTPDGK